MPIAGPMAQLSRPYQIALAAAVAALGLFAVWSLALHHSGSGPGSSPASPAAATPAASTPSSASSGSAGKASAAAGGASKPPALAGSASTPSASTPIYHGSAPGVEGLSRAIDRAHGAVATSEQNAKQLQEKSAQASSGQVTPASNASSVGSVQASGSAQTSGSVQASGSAQTSSSAQASTSKSATSVTRPAAVTHGTVTHKPAVVHPSASSPALVAAAVQAAQRAELTQELAQGKTVLLLFWNPKSTDDAEVRKQMQAVAAHLKGKVATHVALPGQVGQYGSVTRDVQIFQTPTLLIVGKQGLAVTLTGLVDRYAIEQGILEAKKASGKA
jgi:hypothetical protein